ncbi:MAG: HNH endonuclease [Nitrosopumilus sp.]|nr:HNH endonuclease [Nitrosopumilus sp.]MDA7943061.1 HNH endonuclease [Nitrosopumilus sp.]
MKYAEIASKFLDYYWSQYYVFKLWQGPRNQPAKIGKIMNKHFDDEHRLMRLDEVRRNHPEIVSKCENQIRKMCMHDVIPRFENELSAKKKYFYEFHAVKEYDDPAHNKMINPDAGILINSSARDFLRRNYAPLLRAVIFHWTKFLERFNPTTPRLASKAEGKIEGSRNQAKFRKVLEDGKVRCFYCDCKIKQKSVHVDHVIPFNYIADTQLWNLVLACSGCNCKKSDRLPPKECLDALIERNRTRSEHKEYRDSLCLLGDWEKDIVMHYNNAGSQGFNTLEEFGCGKEKAAKQVLQPCEDEDA